MHTSSHQLSVEVTGSQYPDPGVEYGMEGSQEGILIDFLAIESKKQCSFV